jgi:hypothetical protein
VGLGVAAQPPGGDQRVPALEPGKRLAVGGGIGCLIGGSGAGRAIARPRYGEARRIIYGRSAAVGGGSSNG